MNDIMTFVNEDFGSVRTVSINGEPWLVGKDIALMLGYSNPHKTIRDHVDDEDKGVNESVTPGGRQRTIVINESGFYCLVLSSKLPSAKKRSSVGSHLRYSQRYAKQAAMSMMQKNS